MKIITRSKAIDLLVTKELSVLAEKEREMILLDWWNMDEDDIEFNTLPLFLRRQIQSNELPDDPSSSEYDPILNMALAHCYRGVQNNYIEGRLKELNLGEYTIVGNPIELLACPCCSFLTLDSQGEYYICPVCFWEDDGGDNLNQYSSVNHMTLMEAKRNFNEYGAMSIESKKFTDPDGIQKWKRQ